MFGSRASGHDVNGGEVAPHPRCCPERSTQALMQVIKLSIASILVGLLFLATFATCNNWQWGLFKRASEIVVNGSRTGADVSLYQSERLLQWDGLGYAANEAVDVAMIEGRLWHLPFGVVVPRALAGASLGLGALTLGAVLIAAVAIGTVCKVVWSHGRWSGDAQGTDGAREWRQIVRASLRRGVCMGLVVAVPLGVVCWYITYDRVQSSRFVGDGFAPGMIDVAIGVLAAGVVGFMSLSGHTARNLANSTAGAMSSRCGACGYSLNGLTGTLCPECGSEFARARAQPRRGFTIRWSFAIGLVVFAFAAWMVAWSPAWLLKRVHRVPSLGYAVGYAWNWASVRGEFANWYRIALLNLDDAWRIESDGIVTWARARRLSPEPVLPRPELQSMPIELVWASYDLRTGDLFSSGVLRQRGWESPAPLSNAWALVGGTRWHTNWQAGPGGLISVKVQGDLDHFTAMLYANAPKGVRDDLESALQDTHGGE